MTKPDKGKRAREIYDRLMRLDRPTDLSNNAWATKAGVNTSFFTNLRNGSEPSVGNLRAVLEVAGISLPEFFVHEAGGRLVAPPAPQALAEAFLEALPGLPKRPDRRAEYLAEVVLNVLQLHDNLPSSRIDEGEILPQELQPVLGATKQTGYAR